MTAPVREATADDARAIAQVPVARSHATYCGNVPDAYLDALSVEWRAKRWAAACWSSPPTPRWMMWRRSALPGRAAGEPSAAHRAAPRRRSRVDGGGDAPAGDDGAALDAPLGASEIQPARRFYEALSGEPARIQSVNIGGARLEEIAYGWRDTAMLE